MASFANSSLSVRKRGKYPYTEFCARREHVNMMATLYKFGSLSQSLTLFGRFPPDGNLSNGTGRLSKSGLSSKADELSLPLYDAIFLFLENSCSAYF